MSNESLRLSLQEIASEAFFKNLKMPTEVGSINELDEKGFRKGIMNCVFTGNKNIPPDLVKKPVDYFDGFVSSYSYEEGAVKGLFLIRMNEEGELEPVLLRAIGKDLGMRNMMMVRDAFRSAINLYPEDTMVVIPRNTPETAALTAKLFPGR